ncbi:MAG: hypothetical protein ACRETC_00890 [Gammaproteobacteria bacterium]
MGFWNSDPFAPEEWGKPQRLPLRDWALLIVVFVLSWGLIYALTRVTGLDLPVAAFTACFVSIVATLTCAGIWMYKVPSESPPKILLGTSFGLAVLGFLFLGAELHSSEGNVYEVLFHGNSLIRPWHVNGFSFAYLFFMAAYATFLTAARRWIFLVFGNRDKHKRHESN